MGIRSEYKKWKYKCYLGVNLRRAQRAAESSQKHKRPAQPWSIAIIIPAYNHAAHLPLAWSSAVNQTYRGKYDVFIIDDCSTDTTQRVAKGLLARKHSDNVRTYYKRNANNLRQAASLNSAIDAVDHDIIVILNDDDALTPDALEKIVDGFVAHENIYLIGATSIWFTEDSKVIQYRQDKSKIPELSEYPSKEVKRYRRLDDLNMTHTSMAFFRIAWSAAGGYRDKGKRIHPEANEDRDFQMRVNAIYDVGVYKDYPLAFWRTDSSHGKDY